jgi:hypothetical protein
LPCSRDSINNYIPTKFIFIFALVSMPVFDTIKLQIDFLEDHLQQHFHMLNKNHYQQINDVKLTKNPLFLTILGNEIESYSVHSNLAEYLDETYDKISSLRDICVRCFQRWTRELFNIWKCCCKWSSKKSICNLIVSKTGIDTSAQSALCDNAWKTRSDRLVVHIILHCGGNGNGSHCNSLTWNYIQNV